MGIQSYDYRTVDPKTIKWADHKPCEQVIYNGKLMDYETMAFVMTMEAKLGYNLTIVQGCYSNGAVSQSGGTHDGGGVLDLAAYDGDRKAKVAADLGAFAYPRPYIPGLWGAHVHLGIRNHPCLSGEAKNQQTDWDSRPPKDGLKYHRLWTGYHPGKKIDFVYPPTKGPLVPKPTDVSLARDSLVEAIHALGDAAAHLDNANPARIKAKAQLDAIQLERQNLKGILAALPKR